MLFKRSLAIREKALGPDHPSVAVNQLAGLSKAQGRYAEAELPEGTTNTQKIMMGALAVLAVAGWIAVFFVHQSGGDTEAALAAVKTDLAKKSDELTAAEKKLSAAAKAAGSLADITKRRAAAKTDLETASSQLSALKPQLESARTELASLTPKLDSAKAEYDALNIQIGEAKSELDDLLGAVEKMREQVSKNRPTGSTMGRVEVLPKPSDIAAAPAVMPQEKPVAEVTERAVAPIPESAAKAAEIAALPKTVTPSPQKSRLAEEVHLSKTVGTLADLRQQARGDALEVFATCTPKARCGVRYGFYGMLYNRTVNAFGLMINGLVRQIETDGRVNNSAYSRFTIDDAAVQYSLLKVAFNKIKAGAEPGSNGTASPKLNRIIERTKTDITASFAELSAASQNSRPEERRLIVRTLRALTWSRFEDIRPRDTAAGRENQVPTR